MHSSDTKASTGVVVVREMEMGDADAVAKLTAQLGYARTREEIVNWLAGAAIHRQRQVAYVACLGDDVVGWIEVSLEHRLQSPDFALIGGLVVDENRRGHRIGQRLCERAEQWSWEQGATKIRVTSRNTRVDAHRFLPPRRFRSGQNFDGV